MKDTLTEQNSLLEKIVRDYGRLIRSAVRKAARGLPCGDDIISEVYFAVLLTMRKFGTGWTPPRSFIFTVVKNKVNDFLRQRYRESNGLEGMKEYLATQAAQKKEVVSRIHCLTASEFRVFRLLGLGMTNNEIAAGLHISLDTVRSHLKKIHAKCGIKDRSKLTLIAHLVCYRGQAEEPEAETMCQLPEGSQRRSAQDRTSRRLPGLSEADPPPPPFPVMPSTKYYS
jgi:RNA polymerase sigma factor (sigma-70 family)